MRLSQLCSYEYISDHSTIVQRMIIITNQGFTQDFELGGGQDGSRMIVVYESMLTCA